MDGLSINNEVTRNEKKKKRYFGTRMHCVDEQGRACILLKSAFSYTVVEVSNLMPKYKSLLHLILDLCRGATVSCSNGASPKPGTELAVKQQRTWSELMVQRDTRCTALPFNHHQREQTCYWRRAGGGCAYARRPSGDCFRALGQRFNFRGVWLFAGVRFLASSATTDCTGR